MRIPQKEEGQGLVEYALLLVLVAIVIIVILALMGRTVTTVFAQVYAGLNGQALDGSGKEYVVTNINASATGATVCTVTVSADVVVFIDGQLAGAGEGVSGTASFPPGSGNVSGTTDNSGVASVSTSGSGACSGTATVTVGGNTGSTTYSN